MPRHLFRLVHASLITSTAVLAGCVHSSPRPRGVPAEERPFTPHKPTDLPEGIQKGFAPPRPASPDNPAFVQQLTGWHHLVAKGPQVNIPGVDPNGWYDALVGPLDPADGPVTLAGAGTNPRLNVRSSGVIYLRGRWIAPTTRRTRGISGGGTFYGRPEVSVECPGGKLNYEGTLLVYSGPDKDIIMYPKEQGEPGTNNTVTIIRRHWNPGCSDADFGPNCEAPECFQMTPGNYYVFTSDTVNRKVLVSTFPWAIPAGSGMTHDPKARQMIIAVNNTIATGAVPALVKPLADLSPP
jgi:hypothetical protein